MIKATKHKPPLTHADVKMMQHSMAEGSPAEEKSESKSFERREKMKGID